MNARGLGGEVLGRLSWFIGAAVSLPVVVVYVTLGAALLVGRSLLLVAGGTWRRLSLLGGIARHESGHTREAA